MSIPTAVASAFITDQLATRSFVPTNLLQEKIAVQDIAKLMVKDPAAVLPRLVDLAMEMCDAVSGGFSIHERENGVFRWQHLRGTLAAFEGATTPRNDSPCGITLDLCRVMLIKHPEQVYKWVADAGIALSEVLLVPLTIGTDEPLGTLWIVADQPGHFTSAHASTLQDLAGFTGLALQMIQTEKQLSASLAEQATLTQEMSHRVKNLFAITGGMIRLTARGAATKEEFADSLSSRLNALASANSLVRKSFNDIGDEVSSSNLGEIVGAVLAPYDHAPRKLEGERVALGDRATSSVAMLFHELATNAAKYGALGSEDGTITVNWAKVDGVLQINWTETGGPAIPRAPENRSFGSKLIDSTVANLNGAITYDWRPTGVVISLKLPLASLAD